MALSKTQRLSVAKYPTLDKVRITPLEVRLVDKSSNKACMVIPKRFVPKATDRNKIRRRCLEFTRKSFQDNEIGSIIIRVYAVPAKDADLTSILSKCIHQLRC